MEGDVEAEILLLGAEGSGYESNINNVFLHGRQIDDQFDFDLGNSWIQMGANIHGEACAPMLLNDHSTQSSRLIDVEGGTIVSATFSCSCAALSYRWTEDQLTFNQSTYKQCVK